MLRLDLETFGPHRVAAAPGTHAQLAQLVARYVDCSARILDLGAYSGALIARLRTLGYEHLSAADLANHLTEPVDSFRACDFNSQFSDNFEHGTFGAIVASEVIEHLDNPRAFLRECHKLLEPGGHLILSTPNVQFFEGRIKFLLTGELWGFGAKNYLSQRHITPISAQQWPIMARESGYEPIEMVTGASFATSLRKALTAPLWAPMRLLFGPKVLGETLFLVSRSLSGSHDAAGQQAWS